MMNEYTLQGLKYVIDLANDVEPTPIVAKKALNLALDVMNYALQLFDIESDKFNQVLAAIGIDEYLDVELLKLIYQFNTLAYEADDEAAEEILAILITTKVSEQSLQKAIDELCLAYILRGKQIIKYKTYIESVLPLVSNAEIETISIFR